MISARRIAQYAHVCAAHNRLEKLRYAIRAKLLAALDEGCAPSNAGPFVLVRSAQSRVDGELWSWKIFATELAIKYYMALGEPDAVAAAMGLILSTELGAPRKSIAVLSAKPNPLLLKEV